MKGNVLVLVFVVIVIFGGFTGCDIGNGNVIDQDRTVEGFNGIKLDGVGDVKVHTGENYRVVVTTDSNLQDRVLTTVNGNILRITQRSGSFNATRLTIDVYLPELTSISLNGAGNFTVNSGDASELNLSLSGTGNINAQNFEVQNVTITHSGVGNARIWATNTLNGNLSGVGNILYKGNPTINVNRTGVGNFKPLKYKTGGTSHNQSVYASNILLTKIISAYHDAFIYMFIFSILSAPGQFARGTYHVLKNNGARRSTC
jgi:hypothetical protein